MDFFKRKGTNVGKLHCHCLLLPGLFTPHCNLGLELWLRSRLGCGTGLVTDAYF